MFNTAKSLFICRFSGVPSFSILRFFPVMCSSDVSRVQYEEALRNLINRNALREQGFSHTCTPRHT